MLSDFSCYLLARDLVVEKSRWTSHFDWLSNIGGTLNCRFHVRSIAAESMVKTPRMCLLPFHNLRCSVTAKLCIRICLYTEGFQSSLVKFWQRIFVLSTDEGHLVCNRNTGCCPYLLELNPSTDALANLVGVGADSSWIFFLSRFISFCRCLSFNLLKCYLGLYSIILPWCL